MILQHAKSLVNELHYCVTHPGEALSDSLRSCSRLRQVRLQKCNEHVGGNLACCEISSAWLFIVAGFDGRKRFLV